MEREAREVAEDYPETAFLMGSSGGPQGDTVGVFGTRNHGVAYPAGMLVGATSETGVFGTVGGYPTPEVNLLVNALRFGVREVNPEERDAKAIGSLIVHTPRYPGTAFANAIWT